MIARSADDQWSQLSVLAVEDNPATRKIFEIYLSNCFGYVRTARNAHEAITQAQARTFDLLVLDINLGIGLSGDELLQRLREFSQYERTPALACTAYVERTDEQRFLYAGFDGFLAKPFTREQLYTAVEPLVTRIHAPWPISREAQR